MVVSDEIHNIMGGIENAGDVRMHNHRRKLTQRFDIVKKLGQGTYGKVQLGINKETGQEVAIKTIRKCKIETEADLIRIRREIQIMSSVRHPNIIHIYEVFENREKIVLVMEYAAGGELYDYLSERKRLTEDEARRIFRQIATAVYYCHKHNICHRDLKLENILLDEVGNAKIADFGLSNVFSYSSLLSTFCGSPLYASPEIVKGTPYHGPEVDCWSLGVLLYTLVYGAMPFDGSNFKRLVKQISQGHHFEPSNPSTASPLISDMLEVSPTKRANISAICSHWWINKTYEETCLDVAEDLACQTPVRLDLLLTITASTVNSEKIVVGVDPVTGDEDLNCIADKPIRSLSLGSILPTVPTSMASLTLAETVKIDETTIEKEKPKAKKKECSHRKVKHKERSRSHPRKLEEPESNEKSSTKGENDGSRALRAPALVNSDTQTIETPKSNESTSAQPTVRLNNTSAEKEFREEESKSKLVERRKSNVFEPGEKFTDESAISVMKTTSPTEMALGFDTPGTKKEGERRSSSAFDVSMLHKPEKTNASRTSPDDEPLLSLASTIALDKLIESAFHDDELPFEKPTTSSCEVGTTGKDGKNAASVATNALIGVVGENGNKAATLPRTKISSAEIQLIQPQLLPNNYKSEVEHFVNKPIINHKTEIVFPISPPLPSK